MAEVNFKVPSEPYPIPTVTSDDDDDLSFVVLGKSLSDDMSFPDEAISDLPRGSEIIKQTQDLIANELSKLELTSNGTCATSMSHANLPQLEGVSVPKTSYSSIVSEACSTEFISSKITELIDENNRLKDTVIQNNLTMQSQYERIKAWEKEVQDIFNSHKKKLMLAKDDIEKFKSENKSLQTQVDNLTKISDAQATELNELKNKMKDAEKQTEMKLLQTSAKNIKEFELDAANKKITELQEMYVALETRNKKLLDENSKKEDKIESLNDQNNKLSEELKMVMEYDKSGIEKEENEIKQQWNQAAANWEQTKKDLLEENMKLRIDNDLLNSEINKLAMEIQKLNEDKRSVCEMEVKVDFLTEQHEKNCKYIVFNEELLQENKKLTRNIALLNEEKDKLMGERRSVGEYELKIDVLQKEIHNLHLHIKEIDQQNNARKGVNIDEIEKLRRDIVLLKEDKEKLMAERRPVDEYELKIDALQKEIQNLRLYVKETDQQNIATNGANLEEMENMRQQLMNAQVRITEMEQEKKKSVSIFNEKELELKNLKEEIATQNIQLDIYKSDFEAEQSAKETIKKEKQQIADDLQQLQHRNHQLQEEIEVLRDRNFEYLPSHVKQEKLRTARQSSSAPSRSSVENKCPVCQFLFPTYKDLERHVEVCLNVAEALP